MAGVTINIGYTEGVYDRDVTYTYVTDGATINVTDTIEPDGLQGYRKCVHRTQGGTKINGIQDARQVLSGFQDLGKYTFTTVYLWKEDKGHNNPLLVKLGEKYYSRNDGKNWSIEDGINPYTIQKFLDGQNCKHNSAHIVDIGHNVVGDGGRYKCPGCSKANILLNHDETLHSYQYILYYHSPMGKVGNIRNGGLTIHSPSENVHTVHVIWYGDPAVPLLFFYTVRDKNRWFSRYYGDNVWTALNDALSKGDVGKIEALLEKMVIPRVTIDVSTSQSLYTPNGNSLQFSMQKTPLDSTDYSQFKHTRVPPGDFTLKNVTYGKTRLEGIKSDESLSSVSAFYHGNDPRFESDLLMVELEKKGASSSDRYAYYSRPDLTGGNWKREQNSSKLTEGPLKEKLDALKKMHFHDSSHRGGTPDAKQSSSVNITAITGGIAGCIVCTLLCLAIWRFYPALNGCLSGRQFRPLW